MAIETMKESVIKVLHIWQAWSLFPPSFVTKLERILLRGTAEVREPLPSQEGREVSEGSDVDGEAIESADEDVDGEPMQEEGEKQPPTHCTGGGGGGAGGGEGGGKEARLRSLTLREVEAVCDANGISTNGSRAEMLQASPCLSCIFDPPAAHSPSPLLPSLQTTPAPPRR